jgi:gamma-glutamyltranspeptidase / glutathione hydrolase
VESLRERGHKPTVAARDSLDFGAAQLIYRTDDDAYVAASDSRRDGQAVGF